MGLADILTFAHLLTEMYFGAVNLQLALLKLRTLI